MKQDNNQEKIQKSKTKKAVNTVAAILSYSLVIGIGFGLVNQNIQVRNKFEGVDTNYFVKTIFDTPVYLPIKNGEILLNIEDDFTEEEKTQIIQGIEKLDNVADGFDYKITFENEDIKKAINIKGWDSSLEKQNELGLAVATTPVNNLTAEIYYPITINFNTEGLHKKNQNFSRIVQHELLHTLGFTDLYDNKHHNYMMYGGLNKVKELTNLEKEMLNTIYSPARTGYTVEKPKQVKYVNASFDYKFNDEDTLEF